jgi:NAD(P)-dependent dehydrogenase (short-subunit alcohol dehydrogenase family)
MNDLFDLSGRHAFVTGAGSGIGQGIAIGLAEAGADVACIDLKETEELSRTAAEIEKAGRKAIKILADVSKKQDIVNAVEKTISIFGCLDLAVNCAGIANACHAEDMSEEQWDRMIAVDFKGVFLSCQAEGRAMIAAGGGSIVNIASMSGVICNKGLYQVHYNSAKAGVIHLSKSLAAEWAGKNIRVNAISPGNTFSPMNKRPEVANQIKDFAEQTPLGRLAEVREMVGPAIFLSSKAASYCTGVIR